MESRPYSWVALDPECEHPREEKEEKEGRRCSVCCNGNGFGEDNAFIDQDLAQANLNKHDGLNCCIHKYAPPVASLP